MDFHFSTSSSNSEFNKHIIEYLTLFVNLLSLLATVYFTKKLVNNDDNREKRVIEDRKFDLDHKRIYSLLLSKVKPNVNINNSFKNDSPESQFNITFKELIKNKENSELLKIVYYEFYNEYPDMMSPDYFFKDNNI